MISVEKEELEELLKGKSIRYFTSNTITFSDDSQLKIVPEEGSKGDAEIEDVLLNIPIDSIYFFETYENWDEYISDSCLDLEDKEGKMVAHIPARAIYEYNEECKVYLIYTKNSNSYKFTLIN